MKKGFTLIELLIVISIIAVLTTAALIFYQEFNKRARDSKRQSDLKIIQSALEDYHADQLYYPASLGTSLTFGTKTYLNTVPADPKPSPYPNYSYNATPSGCSGAACTGYCLSAKLEGPDPADECIPASGTANYNYGVTRP